MSKVVKQAVFTGSEVTVGKAKLYRIECPECHGIQWHKAGAGECIFCSATFTVTPQSPAKPTEDQRDEGK
jgi:hypothetical protein